MCTFIGIENLAANALIEILEKTEKREVSFDTLVRYGMQVVRIFQQETGEEAVLLLSKKYQINMLENYSAFFEADSIKQDVFRLKKGTSIEDLKDYFRWSMNLQLIQAFTDPNAIRELGVIV